MTFTEALGSLDWGTIFDSLDWSDVASGSIQGGATIMAAVVALVAVLIGTRSTHRKNYNEWKWNHLFDALVELDSLALEWHRKLNEYAALLYSGETISQTEHREFIMPIYGQAMSVRRRINVLMPKRRVLEDITEYLSSVTFAISMIDELNRHNHNRDAYEYPDESMRNGWIGTVDQALDIMATRHKTMLAKTDQDVRMVTNRRSVSKKLRKVFTRKRR